MFDTGILKQYSLTLFMPIIFQLLDKIQLNFFNKNEINKLKNTIVKSQINYKDTKNSLSKNFSKRMIHHQENT